jgi:probable F420-dependent oxidoreductase
MNRFATRVEMMRWSSMFASAIGAAGTIRPSECLAQSFWVESNQSRGKPASKRQPLSTLDFRDKPMKIGVGTLITDEGVSPQTLAMALEARGFDSLIVGEHSHIPVRSSSSYPWGDGTPAECMRVLDPFVALAAAATVTSRLTLGTGVLLLAQRDVIQTAKQVASLDLISDGRFLLGVGLGWNLQEAADHGIDPATRGHIVDEKLRAIKEIWLHDEAEFHGEHVDFGPSFCWPKPVQHPHPPIYIGGFTQSTVARARRHGAGWMPLSVPAADMVAAQFELLDGAVDIPVTVVAPPNVSPSVLEAYRENGVERVLITLDATNQTLKTLDELATLVAWVG